MCIRDRGMTPAPEVYAKGARPLRAGLSSCQRHPAWGMTQNSKGLIAGTRPLRAGLALCQRHPAWGMTQTPEVYAKGARPLRAGLASCQRHPAWGMTQTPEVYAKGARPLRAGLASTNGGVHIMHMVRMTRSLKAPADGARHRGLRAGTRPLRPSLAGHRVNDIVLRG